MYQTHQAQIQLLRVKARHPFHQEISGEKEMVVLILLFLSSSTMHVLMTKEKYRGQSVSNFDEKLKQPVLV